MFESGEALNDLAEFNDTDEDTLSELEMNLIIRDEDNDRTTTTTITNDDNNNKNDNINDNDFNYSTLDIALKSVANSRKEVVVIPTNAFFSPLARNQVFILFVLSMNFILFNRLLGLFNSIQCVVGDSTRARFG